MKYQSPQWDELALGMEAPEALDVLPTDEELLNPSTGREPSSLGVVDPANAKDEFSNERGELLGVADPEDDLQERVTKLQELQGSDKDYGDFDNSKDMAKARNREMWGGILGALFSMARPEHQGLGKAAQAILGKSAAQAKDRAERGLVEHERKRPVSDAQAEQLVRTYGMNPEAAHKMTAREWGEILPLLKSTPYVNNQAQSQALKKVIEERKLEADILGDGLKAKTAVDVAEIGADARVEAAGIRAKKGGGGGGKPLSPEADDADAAQLISSSQSIPPDQAAAIVKSIRETGQVPPGTPNDIAPHALLIANAHGKRREQVFKDVVKYNINHPRVLPDNLTPQQLMAAEASYDQIAPSAQLAKDYLFGYTSEKSGKVVPPISDKVVTAMAQIGYDKLGTLRQDTSFTEREHKAMRVIQDLVAQVSHERFGAALSAGEREMLSKFTGVNTSDTWSRVTANPATLKAFVAAAHKAVLAQKKRIAAASDRTRIPGATP